MAQPLLTKEQLRGLQRTHTPGRYKLHDVAREVIQFLNGQPETSGPFDVSGNNWPTWKTYIAKHKGAEDLVGTGITAIMGEFIEGTEDPNRGGKRRLDLAIYHADGGYVRIHPGTSRLRSRSTSRRPEQQAVLQSTLAQNGTPAVLQAFGTGTAPSVSHKLISSA